MLSGKLWPAHPKPFPDELLTSWIVRVAEANGAKLQRLCWDLFGNERSPWNRDADRSAPRWLIKAFSEHTGTPFWDAYRTTLTTYRGQLFPARQVSGQLRWVLPIRTHGMQRDGFGQQFCPQCLTEDAVPYFRKTWRLAMFTFCPMHQVMLHDACPNCGVPVAFHRRDFGVELVEAKPICCCYACGFDFREGERKEPLFADQEGREFPVRILTSIADRDAADERFDLGFFAVAHQFCHVLGGKLNANRLGRFIIHQLGVELEPWERSRKYFERRRIQERHQMLLCVWWLMQQPEVRIRQAWEAKAVRYNLMLKDIRGCPKWYRELAERCSNWRRGYRQFRINL